MVHKKLVFFSLIIFFFPLVSSAHYVIGIVWNSTNGTLADNQTVTAWNPCFNPFVNNITDIIGESGNSGTQNVYMLDSDVLGSPVGSYLRVALTPNLNNYVDVVITGLGSDVAPKNLTYDNNISFAYASVCPISSSSNDVVATPSLLSVIANGGSFKDVLITYNPFLYEELRNSIKSLFSGNYTSFPNQFFQTFRIFVRYVGKEQASLVHYEVNKTK